MEFLNKLVKISIKKGLSISILSVDIGPPIVMLVEYQSTHLLFVNLIQVFEGGVCNWHKPILLVDLDSVDLEVAFTWGL